MIAAFQFLFFALFLFVNNRSRSVANTLFALFLLGKGTILGYNTLLSLFSGSDLPFGLLIEQTYFAVLLVYPPLLYLYVKASVTKEFKFMKWQLAHFIPAFAALITHQFPIAQSQVLIYFANAFYYVQAASYALFGLILLRRLSQVAKSELSFKQQSIKKWLATLLGVFLVILAIFATDFVLSLLGLSSEVVSLGLMTSGLIMLFLFANGMLFNSMRNAPLFSDFPLDPFLKKEKPLPRVVNERAAGELAELMKRERLFLDPDLGLSGVAQTLDIHPRSVSLILKHFYGQSFSEFINGYRVRNAQKLIEQDTSNRTFMDILMDSGFRSKSVFNATFKKHTGMTPTTFRDRCQKTSLPDVIENRSEVLST